MHWKNKEGKSASMDHCNVIPWIFGVWHERHNNAKSTGCPKHTNPEEEEGSNHEEEEGTPPARTLTMSYRRLGKHKGRIKQNATVSH